MKIKSRSSFLWVLFAAIFFVATARANTELDKLYRLRNVIGVVVDTDREAVYGETVENELVRYLRSQTRFAYMDEAYVQLKDIIKAEEANAFLRGSGSDRVRQIIPQVRQLSKSGVDAVFFGSLDQIEGKYYIDFLAVNAANGETLTSSHTEVESTATIADFTASAKAGITELVGKLPFDGSILSREGYRVVIDLGRADMRPGAEVPVFTIERQDNRPNLVETGRIQLTQVDENLSFGKILVDNKPAEVMAGNKILFSSRSVYKTVMGTAEEHKSIPRQYGYVDARAGLSSQSLSQSSGGGAPAVTSGQTFPTLELSTEIWLNSKYYLNIFYSGGVTASVSDFRALAGYRWAIFNSLSLPYVNLKLGYASSQYTLNTGSTALQYSGSSFSGIDLGIGIWFPFTDRFSMGFDVATFLFTGFSASLNSSSHANGASASDLSFQASYLLSPSVNLNARLKYFGAGVSFNGPNASYVNSSLNEGVTSFTGGVSYYF
jgi:hypothetical protein